MLNFGTGHADKFLASIEKDIILSSSASTRADPAQRFLGGSSPGNCSRSTRCTPSPSCYTSPPAPPSGWRTTWLIRRARDWAKTGKPINARLYVTGAEFEWPKFLAAIKRYQAALPERSSTLALPSRPASSTASATPAPRPKAMRAACAMCLQLLAPETGPDKDN